jgi:hypothetical protein
MGFRVLRFRVLKFRVYRLLLASWSPCGTYPRTIIGRSCWHNIGRILVEYWHNIGIILAEYWQNIGIILTDILADILAEILADKTAPYPAVLRILEPIAVHFRG